MTELPKQYHITITLRPIYHSQKQCILVQSEEYDEDATAPADWALQFDQRGGFGYVAMFTRIGFLFSSNTVTISLAYSDKLATAQEIVVNDQTGVD